MSSLSAVHPHLIVRGRFRTASARGERANNQREPQPCDQVRAESGVPEERPRSTTFQGWRTSRGSLCRFPVSHSRKRRRPLRVGENSRLHDACRWLPFPVSESLKNRATRFETCKRFKHTQRGSDAQDPLLARFCTPTRGVSPAIFGATSLFSTFLKRDRLSLSRPMKRSGLAEKDQSQTSSASSITPFFRRTFALFLVETSDGFFWERFAGKTFRKLRGSSAPKAGMLETVASTASSALMKSRPAECAVENRPACHAAWEFACLNRASSRKQRLLPAFWEKAGGLGAFRRDASFAPVGDKQEI